MATLYTYANSRPTSQQIRSEIIKERPYLYITATKALAKERHEIIPVRQQETDRKKIALFADVIRLFLKQNQYHIATRGEERTLFQRSVEQVFAHNPSFIELFRKDTTSWINVLRDLATKGIDLTLHALPPHLSDILVHPDMEVHARELHRAFGKKLHDNKLQFFETAAFEFLTTQFIPEPVVIMEGFTFFTELQKLFIKACVDRGADVKFLVAYNPNQPKGFEVIDNTYQGVPRKALNTLPISQYKDLEFLQSHLFANVDKSFSQKVERIRVTAYPNRDREMLACIQQLQTWFQDGTYKPSDVVIVMRRSKEFIDRLRDQLALNPLTNRIEVDGQMVEKEVKLFIPPRLLLLTPVGRFVLSLYQIWKQGQLQMSMNEFESILASGWLGPRIQDSASLFRALKHQYFSHCNKREEWHEALEHLRNHHLASYERLPQRLVQGNTAIIRKWSDTIEMLNGVCKRLFSSEESIDRCSHPKITPRIDEIDTEKNSGIGKASYEEAFKEAGIPVVTDIGGGFFRKREIVHCYYMLQAILKYRDDVSLDLALGTPFLPFRAPVHAYRQNGQVSPLRDWFESEQACRDWYEGIQEIRRRMKIDLVPHLLTKMYEFTRIREFYKREGNGHAIANLEKLVMWSREQMDSEALTLQQFFDRFQTAMLTDEKMDEADTGEEEEHSRPNAVRFSTVHSAKGLEYKIVIIPEIHRKLLKDHQIPTFFDIETDGWGLDLMLPGGRGRSPRYNEWMARYRMSLLEEEARVFYVAITRAQHVIHLLSGGDRLFESEFPSEWWSWKDEVIKSYSGLESLGKAKVSLPNARNIIRRRY